MTRNKIDINIPNPFWWSKLANIILDLEKLRSKEIYWEIPPHIFFQLKDVFQMLETLGSARIEWNNTTLAEYIDKVIERKWKKVIVDKKEWQLEIENIENSIKFIEENTTSETKINRAYVSELHKIITKDLTAPPNWEGSKNPWNLRNHNVKINKSNHVPPDYGLLFDYFEEFINFINTNHFEQYQLLMIAIAHHRFAFIHPFDNWNGRMWRLLNYAFLIKLWFAKKESRIINPSSVFYTDRDKYYEMLWIADSLSEEWLLKWSEYFLLWLKNEVEKIDSLLNKEYVTQQILIPAIDFSLDRKVLTQDEYNILKYIIWKDDMLIKSEELWKLWITDSVKKSRIMTRLKNKNIIHSISKWWRIYTISFVDNNLLRWIIQVLEKEWFVSDFLNKN